MRSSTRQEEAFLTLNATWLRSTNTDMGLHGRRGDPRSIVMIRTTPLVRLKQTLPKISTYQQIRSRSISKTHYSGFILGCCRCYFSFTLRINSKWL